MPRSNWKGSISFGLVSIPIVLFNSENPSEKVSFHQIDKRNKARIKFQRINTETGKEVPWENIIKGYQYDKDTVLPVEEGELTKVAGENARTIAIENFVPNNSIDFLHVNKTYYLVPDKKGQKGYVILREALNKTKKIGIAKVIISTKEYLAAIACYQNALVLYLLRYHNEIRPLSEFDIPSENLKEYKVNTKEIEVASKLINSMSSKWKPQKYKDEYETLVHQWAENKIKHKKPPKMASRSRASEPTDKANFVELLKKSLGESGRKKTSAVHLKKKPSREKRASLH